MAFHPKVGDRLVISGRTYLVEPNPSAPQYPYFQTGRKGKVYQLLDELTKNHYALKVFNQQFRQPDIERSAESLKPFQSLPGMRACNRRVINAANNGSLLRQYPDLEYSVLMPWIEGETWTDIIFSQKELPRSESNPLAANMAYVLQVLEASQLAHCDVAGTNTIIQASPNEVQLVDIEDMYGPGFQAPQDPPAGTDGYAHKEIRATGMWNAQTDRFAGAVLMTEMLIWHEARARSARHEGSFFDQREVGMRCERQDLAMEVLRRDYNARVAEAFETAWFSNSVSDCPSFADWWKLTMLLAPIRDSEEGVEPVAAMVGRGTPRATNSPIVFMKTPPDTLTEPGMRMRSFAETGQAIAFGANALELALLLVGLPLFAVLLCGGLSSTLVEVPFIAAIWGDIPLLALVSPLFQAAYRRKWVTWVGYVATTILGGVIEQSETLRLSLDSALWISLGAIVSGLVIVGLIRLTDGFTLNGTYRSRDLLAQMAISTLGTLVLYVITFGYIPYGIVIAPLIAAFGWVVGDRVLTRLISSRESSGRRKQLVR